MTRLNWIEEEESFEVRVGSWRLGVFRLECSTGVVFWDVSFIYGWTENQRFLVLGRGRAKEIGEAQDAAESWLRERLRSELQAFDPTEEEPAAMGNATAAMMVEAGRLAVWIVGGEKEKAADGLARLVEIAELAVEEAS